MSITSKNSAAAILGIFLALGMVGTAYLVGEAIYAVKATERYVIVKGFAEKELPADLVIWPIAYTATGNDLAEVQHQLDADKQKIIAFLTAREFSTDEISSSIPQITDYQTQGYSSNNGLRYRYSAQSIHTLRSGKVRETKTPCRLRMP